LLQPSLQRDLDFLLCGYGHVRFIAREETGHFGLNSASA
jgi:hypothetical protein